jgi:FMNH2-dependent dimethyl sulfone monooxygenase
VRYGYWMPVFGGWLRNVPDEGMQATWEYTRDLAILAEKIGL